MYGEGSRMSDGRVDTEEFELKDKLKLDDRWIQLKPVS